MQYTERARESAEAIVEQFKNPANLPKALASIWLDISDDRPCAKWSWNNRFLVALFGGGDARGFRQWQEVGRSVKKGAKSFAILAPKKRMISVKNPETGEEEKRAIVTGFTHVSVFSIDNTEGEPLPVNEEHKAFVQSLPLREVAASWGLDVELVNGKGRFQGYYSSSHSVIALSVSNLSTWAHELMHAADDRRGALQKEGRETLSYMEGEIVAELGASVLLSILGQSVDADLGGAWRYITAYCEKHKREPISACSMLLDRICGGVDLILRTAAELASTPTEANNQQFERIAV
jgi:hypothetical protein